MLFYGIPIRDGFELVESLSPSECSGSLTDTSRSSYGLGASWSDKLSVKASGLAE